MNVDFYGVYRLLVGRKTVEVDLPAGGTLLDLLNAAVAPYPALRMQMFDGSGRLYPYIPLFINGRNPRLLPDGIHLIVRPQDVLSVFSPIASGKINVEEVK